MAGSRRISRVFRRNPSIVFLSLQRGAVVSASTQALIEKLRAFRDERDWAQFHDVSRLVRAVAVEAGELVETVQWLTDEQINTMARAPALKQRLMEESADVLLYLLLLSDKVGFDLLDAAAKKIDLNAEKYPVAKARGTARKYDQL